MTIHKFSTKLKKKSQVEHLDLDKVRVDDTSMFKKGTENRWSDEVHVFQKASGKTVI